MFGHGLSAAAEARLAGPSWYFDSLEVFDMKTE